MAFEKARRVMIISGISAFAIACLGLAMPDGSLILKICAVGSVILLIAAAGIYFIYGKCPYCKKDLGISIFFVKKCPHCKEEFNSKPHI